MNLQSTGWNSLTAAQLIGPLCIIANCSLGLVQSVWQRSTTLFQGTWRTNSLAYTGSKQLS